MIVLFLVAALQSVPSVAVPPPPVFPVVIWVKSEGVVATARVVLLNDMKEFGRPVEETLYAKLYVAGSPVAIELYRVRGDERVPPGGYATEEYRFTIPKGIVGDTVLSFSNDGDGYRFQSIQK